MRSIRQRSTSAELRVQAVLRKKAIRFTANGSGLPGSPDFIAEGRLAVFVDGCFWHGCPQHFVLPRNNRSWWRTKILTNRRRDRSKDRLLRSRGYSVIHIWEHDSLDRVEERLLMALRSLNLR
jgi:DNA mismatch endonuclease (patch repair protein)